MITEYARTSDPGLHQYINDIANIPVLSRAEETTLIPAAKAGDQYAMEKVIRANLRFVVKIALEYEETRMPLFDLISEGNLGLFRALETFDPTRGIKFITYAKWWIRQCIVHALIYKAHLVRIPQSQLRKLRRLKKMANEFVKENQRQPTIGEVGDSTLNLSDTTMAEGFSFSLQSLDSPFTNEDEDSLIDILPNGEAQPDQGVDDDSLRQDIDLALSQLRPREIEILKLLFGFTTGKQETLGTVGIRYGISKERVRQIRDEALAKMRGAHTTREALRLYLN